MWRVGTLQPRRQPAALPLSFQPPLDCICEIQCFESCSAQFDGATFIHFFIHRRENLRSFKDR